MPHIYIYYIGSGEFIASCLPNKRAVERCLSKHFEEPNLELEQDLDFNDLPQDIEVVTDNSVIEITIRKM